MSAVTADFYSWVEGKDGDMGQTTEMVAITGWRVRHTLQSALPTLYCRCCQGSPVLLDQLPMELPGASRMPNKWLKLKIIIAITLFLKVSKIQYIYKFSLNQPNLNVENSTSAKQIPKIKLHCKRVIQCKFKNEINIRLSKGNSFFWRKN